MAWPLLPETFSHFLSDSRKCPPLWPFPQGWRCSNVMDPSVSLGWQTIQKIWMTKHLFKNGPFCPTTWPGFCPFSECTSPSVKEHIGFDSWFWQGGPQFGGSFWWQRWQDNKLELYTRMLVILMCFCSLLNKLRQKSHSGHDGHNQSSLFVLMFL